MAKNLVVFVQDVKQQRIFSWQAEGFLMKLQIGLHRAVCGLRNFKNSRIVYCVELFAM